MNTHRLMPVALLPAIKDAIVETGGCFQPESLWAAIITAFDQVNPPPTTPVTLIAEAMAYTCHALAASPAAAPQQAVSVPEGWRDVINRARDSICAGGLAEYAQHERSIVQPHLDGVYDELDALEKEAAPQPPAATPAPTLTDADIERIARNHGTGGWQTLASMSLFARAIESHLTTAAPAAKEPT